MVLKKRQIILFSSIVCILLSGLLFWKQKVARQDKLQQELKAKEIQISKHKEDFINSSLTRSSFQKNLLLKNKILSKEDIRIFDLIEKNPLLTQDDFNKYETDQGQIQKKITGFLIRSLESRNKKWIEYAQSEIKNLESIEKKINESRHLYSTEVIKLARSKDITAITFLSDIELAKFSNSKTSF